MLMTVKPKGCVEISFFCNKIMAMFVFLFFCINSFDLIHFDLVETSMVV